MSNPNKIYIGDLPRDARKDDIEYAFNYYGDVRSVWISINPPGFAFVEMEDRRDADDAVRGLDGTKIAGRRVRVEHSTSSGRGRFRGGGGGGGGGRGPPRRGFNPDDRCYRCDRTGHYAYDCKESSRGGGRDRSRSPRRSPRRSRSRSYSRSVSRDRTRNSRRSASRSPSRERQTRKRSPSRSRSRTPRRMSNSPRRSRSR